MWTRYNEDETSYRTTLEDGTTIVANLGRTDGPGSMWRGNVYVNGGLEAYSKGSYQYLKGWVSREVKRIKVEKSLP